jgi:hypothetical protein
MVFMWLCDPQRSHLTSRDSVSIFGKGRIRVTEFTLWPPFLHLEKGGFDSFNRVYELFYLPPFFLNTTPFSLITSI